MVRSVVRETEGEVKNGNGQQGKISREDMEGQELVDVLLSKKGATAK